MERKIVHISIGVLLLIGAIFVAAYFAVRLGITNAPGVIDQQQAMFIENDPAWAKGDEWQTLKSAIIKDGEVIARAGNTVGINPRLIASELVAEQLRLFYSNRALFKKVFEPLKILGNQNKFSWGVVGLKESTAIQIENNLKDVSSVFYLGKEYEDLLDFKTDNHNVERFDRIMNEKDQYYSYLYTALYLKQIMKQWKDSGFDISSRPEILSTLFNIGFQHSKPNANPQVGGSSLTIGGKEYSFGGLAAGFYNSGELRNIFP